MKVRRILWPNVLTVISAAILIGAEVFGAGLAGGWALGSLFGLGNIGTYVLEAVFLLSGLYVMALFLRTAMQVEPFMSDRELTRINHIEDQRESN